MPVPNAVPPATPRRPRRQRPRRELSRWQLALGGALLFVLTAAAIYALITQYTARRAAAPVAGVEPAGRALSPDRVQRMIDEVSQRVKSDPRDRSAWALLAHSYEMQGRYDEAVKAYARLAELLPGDAQVLADYADALAVTQGRSFAGEPERLLQRALGIDPKNLKALLLAGSDAFERRRYAEAVGFWERARAVTADAAVTQQIDSGLAEARVLAGGPAASAGAARGVAAAAPGRGVSGRVTLAPALAARADPDDAVFVFARPTLGSRMPVALLRKKVRDLPLDFRLDDTMALVPEIRLSALSGVVVGARVSRRGDATPQPGDLQGITAPVAVGSRDVRVEISEVLP